jgi:hypothetical protein
VPAASVKSNAKAIHFRISFIMAFSLGQVLPEGLRGRSWTARPLMAGAGRRPAEGFRLLL